VVTHVPRGEFAVIYSVATGRIRSIIVRTDEHESIAVSTRLGEALITYTMAHYGPLPDVQATLSQTLGRHPVDDRYVVVDASGHVVAALHADPCCGDGLPEHRLIADAVADCGWRHVDGIFHPPST
jgi:hypothetical protein